MLHVFRWSIVLSLYACAIAFAAEIPAVRTQLEDSVVPTVSCGARKTWSPCPPSLFAAKVSAVTKDGSMGKVFRFTGNEGAREQRHTATWTFDVKPGVAYQFSAWSRIQNRNCYIQPDLSRNPDGSTNEWTGGYGGHKGVFCGHAKIFVKSSQGQGKASASTMFDYPYLMNRQTGWVRNFLNFRNGSADTKVEVSLELDGSDLIFLLDDVRLTEVTPEAGMQEVLADWPAQTPYRFESLGSVDTSGARIETRGTKWELIRGATAQSADGMVLRNRANGIQLVRFDLPAGTLSGLSRSFLKRIPGSSLASEVKFQSAGLSLVIGVDGTAFLQAKRDMRMVVTGRPSGHTELDLGVFFQAALDGSGGFLFGPIYDRALTTGLQSPHPYGTPIFYRNEPDGTYGYNTSLFLHKAGRPKWFHQDPSVPRRVVYEVQSGDRMLLSSFPEAESKPIFKEPFFPIAAVGDCDPLDPTPAAIAKCDLDLEKHVAAGTETIFINSMKWARSIQYPISVYRSTRPKVNLDLKKWTSTTEYLGSSLVPAPEELQACPGTFPPPPSECKVDLSSMTDAQMEAQEARCLAVYRPVCSEPVPFAFDPTGPWETSASEIRKNTLREFLRKAEAKGLKRVLYMAAQYINGDGEEFLSQVNRLWNTDMIDPLNSARLIDGLYFDGFPEGRPIEALKIARGARAIVGNEGLLIFHTSTDATLLPDSYRYRPIYLEKYASALAIGEGDKLVWDLELTEAERAQPLTSCPKVWGLMHAGRGLGVPGYLMFPELRKIDTVKQRLPSGAYETDAELKVRNETLVSVPPARQVEAQFLCGGAIWAPAQFKKQANGAWVETGFSFIDKFNKTWKRLFAPDSSGECGYWKRALNSAKPGFCPASP